MSGILWFLSFVISVAVLTGCGNSTQSIVGNWDKAFPNPQVAEKVEIQLMDGNKVTMYHVDGKWVQASDLVPSVYSENDLNYLYGQTQQRD